MRRGSCQQTHLALCLAHALGRNCAPNSLHDQGSKIKPAENKGIRPRPNNTNVLPIDNHDPRQRHVHTRGQEHRRERKANKVNQEIILGKWVAVEQDSSDVANDFADKAEYEERGVQCCLVLDA